MEQISPYFTPDMNLSIKVMQDPDVVQDCQLILNTLSTDDSYDGSFEDRRYIITTYSFTLKMSYFGPLFGITDPEHHFDEGVRTQVIKKVTTNVNNNKYTVEINPLDAGINDPFVIVKSGPNTDFTGSV